MEESDVFKINGGDDDNDVVSLKTPVSEGGWFQHVSLFAKRNSSIPPNKQLPGNDYRECLLSSTR